MSPRIPNGPSRTSEPLDLLGEATLGVFRGRGAVFGRPEGLRVGGGSAADPRQRSIAGRAGSDNGRTPKVFV